jgi:hypothetical protein
LSKKIRIAAIITASLLISATPAFAGDGSGASANLAISYSAAPLQFDGSGCFKAPVTITYTKTGAPERDISGNVDLEARYPGSNSANKASAYIGYSLPVQGTKADGYFFICSYEVEDNMTTMDITGNVSSDVNFSNKTVAPVTPSQLVINQNPSKLSKPKVTTKKGFISYRTIKGTATATTVTKGVIGAGGRLKLQVKKPKSKNWVEISTTSADSFGEYSFTYQSTKETPLGSSFRVVLTGCGWCTTAQVAGGKFK